MNGRKPEALLSTTFRRHGQLPNITLRNRHTKPFFFVVDERVAERSENKLNLPEMPGAC
jgi:hypothetical protein